MLSFLGIMCLVTSYIVYSRLWCSNIKQSLYDLYSGVCRWSFSKQISKVSHLFCYYAFKPPTPPLTWNFLLDCIDIIGSGFSITSFCSVHFLYQPPISIWFESFPRAFCCTFPLSGCMSNYFSTLRRSFLSWGDYICDESLFVNGYIKWTCSSKSILRIVI